MYWKLKIIIVYIIIFSNFCFSQPNFKGRVGLGLGLNSGLNYFNLKSINHETIKLDDMNNYSFFTGLDGYFYILVIENIRIGFALYSGSTNFKQERKYFKYDFELDGGSIEYTSDLWYSNLNLGLLIGKESISLSFGEIDREIDYKTFNESFNSSFNRKSVYLTTSHIIISPTIKLEHSLTRFFAIRMGIGYILRFNSYWKLDDYILVQNIPSSFNKNNFFLNFGLILGFMSK